MRFIPNICFHVWTTVLEKSENDFPRWTGVRNSILCFPYMSHSATHKAWVIFSPQETQGKFLIPNFYDVWSDAFFVFFRSLSCVHEAPGAKCQVINTNVLGHGEHRMSLLHTLSLASTLNNSWKSWCMWCVIAPAICLRHSWTGLHTLSKIAHKSSRTAHIRGLKDTSEDKVTGRETQKLQVSGAHNKPSHFLAVLLFFPFFAKLKTNWHPVNDLVFSFCNICLTSKQID